MLLSRTWVAGMSPRLMRKFTEHSSHWYMSPLDVGFFCFKKLLLYRFEKNIDLMTSLRNFNTNTNTAMMLFMSAHHASNHQRVTFPQTRW